MAGTSPAMTAWPMRSRGISSPAWLVAALALERGRRLAGLHHHRTGLPAAAALPDELGRQLHDRLGRRRHGLVALGAEFGLGQRWSAGPVIHRFWRPL